MSSQCVALQVTSRDGGSSDWNKGTQAVHVNINYTGVASPPGPAGSIALQQGMWPSVSFQFCELESQINGISCDQALQRHGRGDIYQDVKFTNLLQDLSVQHRSSELPCYFLATYWYQSHWKM